MYMFLLQRSEHLFFNWLMLETEFLFLVTFVCRCLAQINDMEFAERNVLFQPNCQAVIIDAVKVNL